MAEGARIEQFEGCLLGLAAADALGAPLEMLDRAEIAARHGQVTEMLGGGWLELAPGEVTDDTQMALAVAESLAETGTVEAEHVLGRFLAWYESLPKDIGMQTRVVLLRAYNGTPWEVASRETYEATGGEGNGAIMRCAPIALLRYRDLAQLVDDSLAVARLTHYGPLAGWASVVVNVMIADALRGQPDRLSPVLVAEVGQELAQLREAATQLRAQADALPPSHKRAALERQVIEAQKLAEAVGTIHSVLTDIPESAEVLNPGGFVVDTLRAALWCYLQTDSYEEAVVTAVNLGGDADTIGAVVGALAGARYGVEGIPQRWLGQLQHADRLRELARRLHQHAHAAGVPAS